MARAVRGVVAMAGFSLVEVSTLTGIKPGTLSRRVNGLVPFKFPELIKIGRLCGMTVTEIIQTAETVAAQLDAGAIPAPEVAKAAAKAKAKGTAKAKAKAKARAKSDPA